MKSICLEFCLIKIHEGLVAESSWEILVAMWGTPDCGDGGVAHVSVYRVCECACVCLLLAVYLCVCLDISVSYRAAVSPWERGQRRKGLKVFIIKAFLQWREGKELGCKSWCLPPCLSVFVCQRTSLSPSCSLSLSPTYSSRPQSEVWQGYTNVV